MKTTYLCGFMGCGKTTIGKRTAKLMNLPFIDLDEYITEQEGLSIPDIFAQYGEAHFRALEHKYISQLTGAGAVIATGGGAMINPDNAAMAKKGGLVVFLDLSFELCYARIKDDTNRPLVVNNTKQQLAQLFEKRKDIYAAHADITLDANKTPNEVAQALQNVVLQTE